MIKFTTDKKVACILFLLFSVTQAYTQEETQAASNTDYFWLWIFLGRLHLLAVHFPIGHLLIAAILELFTIIKFWSLYGPGINLLVITGKIAAIFSGKLVQLLLISENVLADMRR